MYIDKRIRLFKLHLIMHFNRILILGGARSGKSSFALRLAETCGRRPLYVATAEALDSEMAARIAAHRKARSRRWACVEEPIELASLIADADRNFPERDVLLVDCLTLWLNNILYREGPRSFRRRKTELLSAVHSSRKRILFVSNEVGLGLVPSTPVGRQFRDLAGWLNQSVAAAVDAVLFIVSGLPLVLKGQLPVELKYETEARRSKKDKFRKWKIKK